MTSCPKDLAEKFVQSLEKVCKIILLVPTNLGNANVALQRKKFVGKHSDGSLNGLELTHSP